jgi:hypothetical protein
MAGARIALGAEMRCKGPVLRAAAARALVDVDAIASLVLWRWTPGRLVCLTVAGVGADAWLVDAVADGVAINEFVDLRCASLRGPLGAESIALTANCGASLFAGEGRIPISASSLVVRERFAKGLNADLRRTVLVSG